LKLIEIFKPGRHTAMSGAVIEFSEADLKATADAYDPQLHEAPLVIGHPTLDAPAYGWAKSLQYSGTLQAEPDQVDPAFAEIVEKGHYKKVSASFFRPDAPGNPKPGVYYLRHIGFLGATAPAVKGLKSASFAGGDEGVIEFGDWSDVAQVRVLRRLRDWIIAKFGLEEADKAVSGYELESIEQMVNQPPKPAAQISYSESQQENTMTPEQIAAQQVALKKQKEDQDRRDAEFAERENKIKAQEAKAKRDGIVAFAEELIKAGQLLPRDRSGLVEFMASVDGEAVIEFAEAEGKETRKTRGAQWLREFLERLPKQVDYAEHSRPEGSDTATVSFAAPAGYGVDPARLELHNKALAHQAKHPNTTYDAALAAVSH
jgi:hypothetical protein